MEPIDATQPKPTRELRGFLERLAFALGPLGTGIILDVLDFATFGPVGILLGVVVGGAAGWILGKYERFDRNLRIAFALCAAAYMTIPLTEPIPVATVLSLLARYFQGPRIRDDRQPTDTLDPPVAARQRVVGS
jgi:NhaP-type Na+/H+ or K+/H+ antiporter